MVLVLMPHAILWPPQAQRQARLQTAQDAQVRTGRQQQEVSLQVRLVVSFVVFCARPSQELRYSCAIGHHHCWVLSPESLAYCTGVVGVSPAVQAVGRNNDVSMQILQERIPLWLRRQVLHLESLEPLKAQQALQHQ